MARKASEASSWRRRLKWSLILLLVGALAGATLALRGMVLARPEGNPERVQVEVPRGASSELIMNRLEAAGLAPYPTVLYWVLRVEGVFDEILAGTYECAGDATTLEVAATLTAAPRLDRVSLTLIPGQTIWHSAQRFADNGIGHVRDLLLLAADRDRLRKEFKLPLASVRAPPGPGVLPTYLEGFLYPDTYFLAPESSTIDVVRRATQRFMEVWTRLKEVYRADMLALRQVYGPLDDQQFVTIASLVEREVKASEEAAIVAGVFYNRLKRGMPLQTDPTLIYHPAQIHDVPSPRHRRDATNPYNTYAHVGLPPGPICSPGKGALIATLRPQRHGYLYFVARRDQRGTHAFAETLAEHRRNIERYLR